MIEVGYTDTCLTIKDSFRGRDEGRDGVSNENEGWRRDWADDVLDGDRSKRAGRVERQTRRTGQEAHFDDRWQFREPVSREEG